MKILAWFLVLYAIAYAGAVHTSEWPDGHKMAGYLFSMAISCAAIVVDGVSRRPRVEPLDVTLLNWSKEDKFSVRNLLDGGVAVFGRSGSGKTSGSGRALMKAIVKANSGGLLLAAKETDADDVRAIFDKAKRTDDLLVINADDELSLRCNFIEYIQKNLKGDTREITKAICTIAESLNSCDSKGRSDDGKFWEAQQERMIYCAVECLKLGLGKVTGPDLQRFISTAAQDPSHKASESWRQEFNNEVIRKAFYARKSRTEQHDFEIAQDYWLNEYPSMADRTRSSIQTGVMQTLHVFNTGIVRELCSTTTNVTPDECLQGRWVLVNLPPSRYWDSGKFVAAGWKFLVEKAILRRKWRKHDPFVVIWIDEAQEFLNKFDAHYLAQCRSHGGCQVILTQSLHSVFGAMPGNAGVQHAQALLTNYATKIAHACGSSTDAGFFSSLIGNAIHHMTGGSMPPNDDLFSAMIGVSKYTASFSEQIHPIVEPRIFQSGLRTGGVENAFLVDGIVIRSDRFHDGASFKFVTFDQRI